MPGSSPKWWTPARTWLHVPEPGALVVVGVDGARFSDALAIIATDVEAKYQWAVGIWERPPDAPDDYEHPLDEIDGAMSELHESFHVWRTYVDPQYIDTLLERWQGRWGNRSVLPWYTSRPTQMGWSVRSFTADVGTGEWSYDGTDRFTAHLKNARKKRLAVYDDEHRQLHTLSKDRHDSPRKIDAAMAAVLSWEARGDAVAAGAHCPSWWGGWLCLERRRNSGPKTSAGGAMRTWNAHAKSHAQAMPGTGNERRRVWLCTGKRTGT